jgi:hypothetical protein
VSRAFIGLCRAGLGRPTCTRIHGDDSHVASHHGSDAVCLVGRVHGCMAQQIQKQNESRVWLTEFVFGPDHACANSRPRPGPADTADLCVPGEPGCARHSQRAVTR